MSDSSLSFVSLSSLNAGRSFWDQIFEVRRYIDSECRGIWTQERKKQICGQLNAEAMKDVLEEMAAKGVEIAGLDICPIDYTNDSDTESLIKLLIDVEDVSGLIKILMSLKYPNEVFNTAGNYTSYMNEYDSHLFSSYNNPVRE